MINRLLANDNAVRVISLLLALLIWMVALQEESQSGGTSLSQERSQVFSNITIEVLNPPTDMEYTLSYTHVNALTLRGNSSVISQTTNDLIRAWVDLDGLEEGVHVLGVSIEKPSALYITSQVEDVTVTIEARIVKDVAVEVAYIGDLPTQANLLPAVIEPQVVTIVGRRSLVDSISKAIAVIDLTYMQGNISDTYALQLFNEEGNDVDGSLVEIIPDRVSVTQELEISRELAIGLPEVTLPDDLVVVSRTAEPATQVVYAGLDALENLTLLGLDDIDLTALDDEELTELGLEETSLLWRMLHEDPTLELIQGERFSQELTVRVQLPEGVRLPTSNGSSFLVVITVEFEWTGEDRSVEVSVYDSDVTPVTGSITEGVYRAAYGEEGP